MWRITYALISALMLTASFAATVMAEAHPAAPAPSGGGATTTTTATTTAPVVTATPNTGVGTLTEQLPAVLLLTLIGLAGVFALAALAARSERHA